MSADNTGVCPRCLARAIEKYEILLQNVMDSYGKVSIEEFEKLRIALGEPPTDLTIGRDLREDYENYTLPTGEFVITYECTCQCCGFNHHYAHTEQLEFNDD